MKKEKYIVEKKNALNEIKENSLTLQETRFLSIYLAKINSRDISTREVVFTLKDFQKIMDLGRLNAKEIEKTLDSLLMKIITIRFDEGGKRGFYKFQIFKKCSLRYDEDICEYIITINAHDDALPLMFDIKQYVKYELWNVLCLKSKNQFRMYEILKQYEKKGSRTLTIEELKGLLGIEINEYPIWERFKTKVIESCKKALKENTDIYFEYEPIKKGRKVASIKFFIHKNKEYKDTVRLDEFISNVDDVENETIQEEIISEHFAKQFTVVELDLIYAIISFRNLKKESEDYFLQTTYKYSVAKCKKTKSLFAYFKKVVEETISNFDDTGLSVADDLDHEIFKSIWADEFAKLTFEQKIEFENLKTIEEKNRYLTSVK